MAASFVKLRIAAWVDIGESLELDYSPFKHQRATRPVVLVLPAIAFPFRALGLCCTSKFVPFGHDAQRGVLRGLSFAFAPTGPTSATLHPLTCVEGLVYQNAIAHFRYLNCKSRVLKDVYRVRSLGGQSQHTLIVLMGCVFPRHEPQPTTHDIKDERSLWDRFNEVRNTCITFACAVDERANLLSL